MKKNFIVTALITIGVIALVSTILVIPYAIYIIYAFIGIAIYFELKRKGYYAIFAILFLNILIAPQLVPYFMFIPDYLNPLNQYPLDVVILAIFFLELLEFCIKRNREIINKVTISGFLYMGIFLIITIYLKGFKINTFIHNYLCPTMVIILIYIYRDTFEKEKMTKVLKGLMIVGIVVGIWGYLEYLSNTNFLNGLYIDSGYISEWDTGFAIGQGFRIKTMIGHSLVNGVFFLMMMIISLYYFKNRDYMIIAQIFFAGDILATGSRSIFVASLAIIVFSIIRYNYNNKLGFNIKNMIKIFLPLIVVFLIVMFTPFGSTFLNRLESDNGSALSRVILFNSFLDSLKGVSLKGIGSAGGLLTVNYQGFDYTIIPENPWIILFFEMSYLIIFYIVFLFLTIKKTMAPEIIILFIIAISGFNSFGVLSSINYALYLLIAIGIVLYNLRQKEKAMVSYEKVLMEEI